MEPEPTSSISEMMLRDWFAGQALVGLLAKRAIEDSFAEVAVWAYGMADAMMEERKA
jgi:hypothetical protein